MRILTELRPTCKWGYREFIILHLHSNNEKTEILPGNEANGMYNTNFYKKLIIMYNHLSLWGAGDGGITNALTSDLFLSVKTSSISE